MEKVFTPAEMEQMLRQRQSELGKRGGPARAKKLSAERRREIARMGGLATKAKREGKEAAA